MLWNEISKKTWFIIMGVGIIFSVSVVAAAIYFAGQHGAYDMAKTVADSVNIQHFIINDKGKLISDKMLIYFAKYTTAEQQKKIVDKHSAKILGDMEDGSGSTLISFPPLKLDREMNDLLQTYKNTPDIVDAQLIYAD